jgi:phosphate transport system permease protein
MPVLESLAEREDSIARLVKRRLKRLGSHSELEDNLKTIARLVKRLESHSEASEIAAETAQLKRAVERCRSGTEAFEALREVVAELLGPAPTDPPPVLPRKQYGVTRWDRAQVKLKALLYEQTWDYSHPSGVGREVFKPRVEQFKGTPVEPLFAYVEEHLVDMLKPRWTFYWGFLTDKSLDIHIFGGIFPELLGTIYLTLGAILFAVPIGVIAAIYFTEYARGGRFVSFLRTCVSTLAGVPSIVFGMFGLAFFLNALHLPKGVLAGSLTLAMVILPTIIRASEEAIRAVPIAYKEAALSLGSGRWHTVVTVILPAALPGILTGIVISMGRAAGETAPIIFTAAASVAAVLSFNPLEAWGAPTAALSWNIYNLCTEHEAVDEIRHVQFGMVMTLVLLVLVLNMTAIVLRARISKKLKG